MAYRSAVVTMKTPQVNPAEPMPNRAGQEDVHGLHPTAPRPQVQLPNSPARIAKSLNALREKAA